MRHLHGWVPGVRLLAVLLTFLALSTTADSQSESPVVGAVRGISFGVFKRLDTVSIDYRSDSAAKFIVTGEANRLVRLSIAPADLVRANDVLVLSIASDQCAYSTDEGDTWTTFASGMLVQEVQFPASADPGGTSSIHVVAGGTVIAAERQRRGDYNGSIVLNTEYVATNAYRAPESHGLTSHPRARSNRNRGITPFNDRSISAGQTQRPIAK